MKEFAVGEGLSTRTYIEPFNILVHEKLSEPDRPRKRGAKLYQRAGSFRQFVQGNLAFVFQGDSALGLFFFAIEESGSDHSIEFGAIEEGIVRRDFHFNSGGDLEVHQIFEKLLTPEESKELLKVMRNPRRFKLEQLT